jgi:peptidoglycan/LPS O-acetylase OafA/YrhL
MARFSYTLYAAHLPVLTFAAASAVGDGHWQPTLKRAAFVSALCCLTLFYAYGTAWLTEFRTDALRRRIERALGLPAPRSPLPSDPAAIDGSRPLQ